jgi:hypothetical protein
MNITDVLARRTDLSPFLVHLTRDASAAVAPRDGPPGAGC